MRIGLHVPLSQDEGTALAEGFKALGHKVVLRSASDFREGQTEGFDLVAVSGLHGNNSTIVDEYKAKGVLTLIADYGYLRRERHWSLGPHLGWVPEFDCPADRWEKLELSLAALCSRPRPRTVIAGQMLGDKSHPFADAESMAAWAVDAAAAIHGDVVFRPHPRSPNVRPVGLDIDALPLADSLARASSVIAWSSNIGHDAMLAGVPAVAHGAAPWAGVTINDRDAYFRRLAYAQWTLDEIASGEALAFALDPKPSAIAEAPKRGRRTKS